MDGFGRAEEIGAWTRDAKTRGLGQGTIDRYRYNLLHFQNYLGGSIATADKQTIRAYVDWHREQNLTTKTIRNRLNALSSFYEFLIFEDIRQDNPVRVVRARYLHQYKSNEEHTYQIISVEDAARLVDACVDIRDKAMVLVLLKTGIRRGELLSMDVNDISWKDQSILLKPKAKRSNKTVFFDDETACYLRRWLEAREGRRPHDGALWISSWGSKVGRRAIDMAIRDAAIYCGLHDPASPHLEDHFSPHACRHWFTTHLLRADMKREYVQWLRGDAIGEAIDAYFHAKSEDVRRSYLAHIPQLGI